MRAIDHRQPDPTRAVSIDPQRFPRLLASNPQLAATPARLTTKTVAITEREKEKLLARTMEGHNDDNVTSLALSPDGKYLASGSFDKTIKLWRVETGECTRTMEGHSDGVFSVAFSPDGQYLASGSDETVKLWSTPHRERRLQARERVYALLSALKHNNSAAHRGVYQLSQHGGPQKSTIKGMVEWWDTDENDTNYNPLIHTFDTGFLVNSAVFSVNSQYVFTTGLNNIKMFSIPGAAGAQAQNGGAEELDFSLLRF